MKKSFESEKSEGVPAILNEVVTDDNLEKVEDYLKEMSTGQIIELLTPMLIQEGSLGALDGNVIKLKALRLIHERKDAKAMTLQEALVDACITRVEARPTGAKYDLGVVDQSGSVTPVHDLGEAKKHIRKAKQEEH